MNGASQARARGRLRVGALLLLFLWLGAGYLALLRLLVRLPWATALWQSGLCVIAGPVLLLLVVRLLSSVKAVHLLPRLFRSPLCLLLDLSQFALPWLGWSALLRLMNAGRLSWPQAVWAAASIAVFSYLTALALILIFRPRPEDVEITRHEVPLQCLPRSFDGYRILHLSDLHAGRSSRLQDTAARLQAAASLSADLLIFTGDLAADGPQRTEAAARLLANFPTKDGAVAVLGNHDHWIGEERVAAALSAAGVAVLLNDHMTISRGGETLHLAGVKDASYTESDDLSAALRGIPDDAPVILLSHTPEILDHPLAARACLTLSGHTHGGQVVLPCIGPIHVPSGVERRLASGLHRIDGRWLFVNRGLGEIFPPLRINCPPEIALLTLRAAPSSD